MSCQQPILSALNSCLYVGSLRHRRHQPKTHRFSYQVYMSYLDLAELDQVFTASRFWSNRSGFSLAPVRFKRKDYFNPESGLSIDEAVRQHVQKHTGKRPEGAIRLLTNLRHLGYLTNPISCYYCFDQQERLQTIVAEVNNTPWDERHAYVLDCKPDEKHQKLYFKKDFHVSPFQEMDMMYNWRCNTPQDKLQLHMSSQKVSSLTEPVNNEKLYRSQQHNELGLLFDATLSLERIELSPANIRRTLLCYPLMPIKVIAGIYWQAAKLYFAKRIPFYPHPKSIAKSHN